MEWSTLDIVSGFFYTWVVGLLPAVIARYVVVKRPLSNRSSIIIALVFCIIFAIGGMFFKGFAGDPSPRFSPAWVLVFFVARWIMRRSGDSQADLIAKLQVMIDYPATEPDRLVWAKDRLAKLQIKTAK
ncbi:hypothetical protein [Sphingorhabdus sp.]|uniref:hypothetical protein n=1 Tax=Sphingorhabdus sp. TaxID=1902408 RepID=UPI003983C547